MKIRTDFVTNSSSSSFSVVVALQDKNGNKFSFCESPYEYNIDDGGECSFNANLGNLLIDNAVNAIKKYRDIEYKLEEVGKEGRNARIENVSVGDQVSLVKIPGQTSCGWWNTVDYAIDVRSEEGSLGILPGEALGVIKDAFEGDFIALKATISSVTPLSKRRKNAKYALISIVIDAEKKCEGQVLAIDDVSKLAQFLVDSVSDDYESYDECWEDEDEDEYDAEEDSMVDQESGDAFEQEIAERKRRFVEAVSKQVSCVGDIAKITVDREYSAWGEFADLIPDNDSELCRLAENVNSTSGDAREKALDEMLAYIRTPSSERSGENFGVGYNDIYYVWNGDKNELLNLAKRLCSGYGPEICEGSEHSEIDLVEGTVKSYAEFKLC